MTSAWIGGGGERGRGRVGSARSASDEELQRVAEAHAFRGAFFLRGGRDTEAGIAGLRELHEAAGVGFEGLARLGEVEPFAEDGVRCQGREFGAKAGVVSVEGADEHALPRLALGGEEELVAAAEHDRAAAEPGFEDEGGVGGDGFGEPLERVLGLGGAGTNGGGAGRVHGAGWPWVVRWSALSGETCGGFGEGAGQAIVIDRFVGGEADFQEAAAVGGEIEI